MKDLLCLAICLVPIGFLLLCFYGASKNAAKDRRLKDLMLKKLEEEK